jgi:hypothetical protein
MKLLHSILFLLLLDSANNVSGDCRLQYKPTYRCYAIAHHTKFDCTRNDRGKYEWAICSDRLIAYDVEPYEMIYSVDYTVSRNLVDVVHKPNGHYTVFIADGSQVDCQFLFETFGTDDGNCGYGTFSERYRKVLP